MVNMKTPISVVVIAKNEEEMIGDCLKSAAFADEIILVDDDSTDATRDIAVQCGAKVFSRRMDNEGRHRNWAYAQAKNDWVLSIDADERVSPELAIEINELLKSGPKFKAYGIPRRNYIGDYWLRYGGEYPAPQTRFFLRKEFKYAEDEVHPRALMQGDTGFLKSDIIHYSHRDIADYLRSLNSQTSLEARKWFLSGRKMTLGKAVWRTFDRCFYRRLLMKQAYKDGVYGLATAVFSGMYQIVSYLKYKEMQVKAQEASSKKSPQHEYQKSAHRL